MNKGLPFIAIMLIFSCTTTQLTKIVPPLSASAILEQSHSHSQPIEWLCTQLNGTADVNQQSIPLNAQLRLRKDSILWLSFRAIMGIEVARVCLSPDSIKILNRLNSTYFLGAIDELSSTYSLPLSYQQVQDIFLARLSINPNSFPEVQVNDQGYSLFASKNDTLQNVRFSTDFLPLEVMQSRSDSQVLKMKYANYQQIDSLWAPKELIFQAQSDSNIVKATISFSKTTLNQARKVKFSIPSSYAPM